VSLKIKDGETILFIGDSITDCGRTSTVKPLGGGYVKMFCDLLISREPAKKVTVINKGISGHKVFQLRDRWADDVLRHRPDWLSIKIGINDLHLHLRNAPESMPPQEFGRIYDNLLRETRAKLPRCRILLIDPFYISRDRNPDSFRAQVLAILPKYLNIVHALSRKYKTRLVKTHELFQKRLVHHEPDTFCPEPVHPNETGHLIIAEAVYAALSR
jgi:lysophospholipase L1-like esterase